MSKTVGVIGGMGPLAGHLFSRLVVEETAAERDQDHLHLLVDSDPSIPDRTAFILGRGVDPRPALQASGMRLVEAGAEVLVMPCNTANIWADELSDALHVPFVRWIEVAIAAVPDHSRVGLMATTGTIQIGHYQQRLAALGHRVFVPDPPNQRLVMAAIYGSDGVKATGRAGPDTQSGLETAGRALVEAGADVLLLACTELPLAISGPTFAGVPTIDPARLAARRVILAAGGNLRGTSYPRLREEGPWTSIS